MRGLINRLVRVRVRVRVSVSRDRDIACFEQLYLPTGLSWMEESLGMRTTFYYGDLSTTDGLTNGNILAYL